MSRLKLGRVAGMSVGEIRWRGFASARRTRDRIRTAVAGSKWDRRRLAAALADHRDLAAVHTALDAERWDDAHRALSEHFGRRPARFVLSPLWRDALAARLRTEFPGAGDDAARRGDRIVAGAFDLLAFRGLRFADDRVPDWHRDPVHDCRAPLRFWSAVRYLDPECGDHKIIWELNRHQYFLQLGRAYWLTGNPVYRDTCLAHLADWLHANPPLVGINWASMLELAFRSVSWLWALNFFADSAIDDRAPWTIDLLLGMERQLAHVERNLSYYFSPNTHLLGEALALYVCGRAIPELKASARREALGRRILVGEIDRQIAPDGGHCERSTHYHRYTLDFYTLALAVARITGDPVAPTLTRAVSRLAHAARLLADSRGRLPHIGDDDAGVLFPLCGRPVDDVRDSLAIAAALVGRPDLRIGRAPEEAFWMLAHPALAGDFESSRTAAPVVATGSGALPQTGYYIARSPAGNHVVIDGGPHGYQNGGHAHADALSLTLGIHGIPLLVDAGTGTYTTDAGLRDRLRSTASHNTLIVDDRPQSVPNGPFHWTHTAASDVRRWRTNGAFDYFEGSHDGYRPLDVEHRRHVLSLHGDLVVVADLVDGDGSHTAAVHWHVDPRWHVEIRGRRIATLTTDGAQAEIVVPHGLMECFWGDDESGLGWCSPEYGRVDPATTIRVSYRATAPLWMMSAIGLNPENPIIDVDNVPVWAEAGVLAHSAAIRIRRAASIDYVLFAHPLDGAHTTWRVAEFETDAHLMFCRLDPNRRVTRVALVDGSRVRTTGRRRVQVALPRPVPDLHVDLGPAAIEPLAAAEARVSGPGFGARIVVGGRELPLAAERRSAPRLSIAATF